MGKSVLRGKKAQSARNAGKPALFAVAAIAFVITVFAVLKLGPGSPGEAAGQSGDLVIVKNEVSETVKFYPYKAGNTKMEVLAVKASDGTIRTAFNTCQVCFSSGRGYYKQEGDELVCQNCGNRFRIDQVEKVRGGCNPGPILKENKTEDETAIVISKDFLEEYKVIFENWR